MTIAKAVNPAPRGDLSAPEPDDPSGNVEYEIQNDDESPLSDDDLAIAQQQNPEELFYSNLADTIEKGVLGSLSSDLLEDFENDLRSREDWEKTLKEGTELLGLKIEERTEPWNGACGVVHPLLAEAAIRFQSEAIVEIFPAQGPVKTNVLGKADPLKDAAALRVQDDMNYRLTVEMVEYRAEHERMLWYLALQGSAFKKVYFDSGLNRQVSVFVPAEDFVVPYGATDLTTAQRFTHIMRKNTNDVKKLQKAGFYSDIDLTEPPKGVQTAQKSRTDPKKSQDKITGQNDANDDRMQLLEMHVDLDLEGFEDVDSDGEDTGIALPYVVTLDRFTGDILSIYRNWKHDDQTKQRRRHFVHYPYIPGFGFYAMGLIHIAGGFAKSATSILRQLVDAGTLSNLPGGLKTKGVRFVRDEDPIEPGEFRDVDVPSGTLKDGIVMLPYKEPSQTLFNLFGTIVDAGKSLAAVADINAQDMNQEAPVGTTLAILERQLKVMTAIQARLHASMKDELSLLKDIIKDHAPIDYDYDTDAPNGRSAKQGDYETTEIIPVSDPNASTMSQRVVQWQAVAQMAQMNPQVFDQTALFRQGLRTMGIKNVDELVPDTGMDNPMDPVSESMAIVTGRKVKAFIFQDHQAHLTVHQAAAQDPKLMQLLGQNPQAQAIMAAGQAHIAEHAAFLYRLQIEQMLGHALPNPDEKLDPQVEKQMSEMMAQAAQKALQQNQTAAAQQQAQQAAQDPVVQQQAQDLQIRQGELALANRKHDDTMQLEKAKLGIKVQDATAQLQTKQKIAGGQLVAKVLADHAHNKVAQAQVVTKAVGDHTRQQTDLTRDALGRIADIAGQGLQHAHEQTMQANEPKSAPTGGNE